MAIYVSTARRKRNTLIIAALTGVIGLAMGWVIGHNKAPSIPGRVHDVQQDADRLASRIESQQIHYDKVLSGDGDLKLDVLDSVDEIRTDLLKTLDRAPWIGQNTRDRLTDAVAALLFATPSRAETQRHELRSSPTLWRAAPGLAG
jgi:hypothetical protein